MDNSGWVALMEVRAGGMGATHHVVATANDMTALNEFLDTTFASDAFRAYSDKVGDIRTVITVNMYRRVRTLGN